MYKICELEAARKLLSVNEKSTEDEIRKSYYQLCKVWHPDKNRDNQEESTKKFKAIGAAYELLCETENGCINIEPDEDDIEWGCFSFFKPSTPKKEIWHVNCWQVELLGSNLFVSHPFYNQQKASRFVFENINGSRCVTLPINDDLEFFRLLTKEIHPTIAAGVNDWLKVSESEATLSLATNLLDKLSIISTLYKFPDELQELIKEILEPDNCYDNYEY